MEYTNTFFVEQGFIDCRFCIKELKILALYDGLLHFCSFLCLSVSHFNVDSLTWNTFQFGEGRLPAN